MEPNQNTPPTPPPENNSAAPAQPAMPSQPNPVNTVVDPAPQQLFAPDPGPFKAPKHGKKKFLIIGLVVAVLLVLGALYFFFFFWPNQPQNVWKTGINRSGQAVDKLVANATQAQSLDAFKKSNINVTLVAKAGEASYSGKLETKFDETKADGSLNITAEDAGNADLALAAKFLSEFKDDAKYPDVYFQVTGIKKLGIDFYAPGLSAYDGKWISVDESYWKTLGISAEDLNKSKDQEITSEDIATTTRSIAATTNEYVFTTSPDKAIFEQRKFIGKEKVDDLNTYHYQVGINKENAKKFCEAIINAAFETPVYKKLGESQEALQNEKADNINSCQESVDKDLKDTDTFDMWIDAKYKLIHKIRLTDDDKPDVYVDIGQNYKGDDLVSLFVNYYDGQEKTDVKFNLQTDIKTHKTTGSLNANGGEGQDAYEIKLVITAEPYSGDITVTKPEGTIPIQDVLKTIGIDPATR